LADGAELNNWNICSPLWAPVKIEKIDQVKWLTLSDSDPYDYSLAERIFPQSKKGQVQFTIQPAQNNTGLLHIELKDDKGTAAMRLIFDDNGQIWLKDRQKFSLVTTYQPNETYNIGISLDVENNNYTLSFNGKDVKKGVRFMSPVAALHRISFRTGDRRYSPNIDSPEEQESDLPDSGKPVSTATYRISQLKTSVK
jgi:hypothetical protein